MTIPISQGVLMIYAENIAYSIEDVKYKYYPDSNYFNFQPLWAQLCALPFVF
jgi:hypothetical protein